jgi:TPR repeat protein
MKSCADPISTLFVYLSYHQTSGRNHPVTSHSNDIEEALAAIEAKDYPTAFAMLTVLADRGNPKAQLNLATLYHLGWGTSPDGKKAAELYAAVGMMGIAEEHISALAYHNLSTLYFVGAPGLGRDTEKGEEYHRLAKDLGFEM